MIINQVQMVLHLSSVFILHIICEFGFFILQTCIFYFSFSFLDTILQIFKTNIQFYWLQTGFTYICFLKTVAKAIDGRYATNFVIVF